MRAGESPQQIAGRLRGLGSLAGPAAPAAGSVSHETIYCAIYAHPRGALRNELISLLRRSHSGRRRRHRTSRASSPLHGITPIALRPAKVTDRTVPGHREGDFLKGAHNRTAISTLVERTSRYTMLARMDGCGAKAALEGFTQRLRSVPEPLRKTLTYDQGSEMALHKALAKRLKIQICFCEPYRPGRRGTNENNDGLMRQYLPKGMDLSHFTDDLAKLGVILNNRPRRVLGYRTPAELFDQLRRQHAAWFIGQPCLGRPPAARQGSALTRLCDAIRCHKA